MGVTSAVSACLTTWIVAGALHWWYHRNDETKAMWERVDGNETVEFSGYTAKEQERIMQHKDGQWVKLS